MPTILLHPHQSAAQPKQLPSHTPNSIMKFSVVLSLGLAALPELASASFASTCRNVRHRGPYCRLLIYRPCSNDFLLLSGTGKTATTSLPSARRRTEHG